jgi:tetratricopeptide (TPR) repeat protein
MKSVTRLVSVLATTLAYSIAPAATPDWPSELATIVREADTAQYSAIGDQQTKAFDTLILRASELEKQYPNRAEPMVLHAYALRAHANTLGRTMSAMMAGKEAVEKLEAAIALDPNVYGVTTYALLGSLYLGPAEVAPAVMGFKTKARTSLQKALALDPKGIEQNLAYAQLLFMDGDYKGTLQYANAALHAVPRLGREKADADLHAPADALIVKAKDKLRNE